MSRIIDPGSLTIAETHFKIARTFREMAAAQPRRAAEFEFWANEWQMNGTAHWMRAFGRNVVTPNVRRAA